MSVFEIIISMLSIVECFSCLYRFNLKAINITDCFISKYKHKNLTYSIVFFLEICTRVICTTSQKALKLIFMKTGKFSIIIFFKTHSLCSVCYNI